MQTPFSPSFKQLKRHLPRLLCYRYATSWSATVSIFLFSQIRRKEWLPCQTHLHLCHVLGSYPVSALNWTLIQSQIFLLPNPWKRLRLEIKVLLILSCLDLHCLSSYTTLSISSLMNSLHPESMTTLPTLSCLVWSLILVDYEGHVHVGGFPLFLPPGALPLQIINSGLTFMSNFFSSVNAAQY